jgi:RNA polymerase sigma-70 factor, ECF subfamily
MDLLDAITIDRARRHDRAAQARLLGQLQDRWFGLCRSLLGNDDLARDATQETAMRFLRDLPRFDGRSSIMTWSLGIAINVVRETRRRQNRTETRQGTHPSPERNPGPADLAQQSERDQLLRCVLGSLSDRQREAIVLRFFDQMSVDETAAAMGCAAGTVKATVHQALRLLRIRLKQLI